MCKIQYKNSCEITAKLVKQVKEQESILEVDKTRMNEVKAKIRVEKDARNERKVESIRQSLDESKRKLFDATSEHGASHWLNCIPLKCYDFHLEKQSFRDALFLRYGIPLKRLPLKCVCGANFDEIHGLNCATGGFTTIRHNEIRDLTAELLNEVCNDVSSEPLLTPLTGENFVFKSTTTDDEARLDISARGFWARGSKAFFDVRVFNPLAKSYSKQPITTVYRNIEKSKKSKYNERIIRTENGSFTPLIFSCFGGIGIEGKRFYKRLFDTIADKRDEKPYLVSNLLRTKISMSLVRSCLLCLRGSRSIRKNQLSTPVVDMDLRLAAVQSQI